MSELRAWYPVSLSAAVEPGAAAGGKLLNREIVIWRDTSGKAHVWEDRCPHRGMKLSFGFVRGDHIACLYHGWQYGSNGRCRYIPAHPDLEVPETIRVPSYGLTEQGGMIWTSLDGDPPFPPVPAEARNAVPVRSVYLRCERGAVALAVEENPFAPFAGGDAVTPTFKTASEGLWVVTGGGDTLLIGVQPVAGGRTALHIAIAGEAAKYNGNGQRHFLSWANALRYRLENQHSRILPRGSGTWR